MAYQYGPCGKRKAKPESVKYPTPTLEDLDLALRDVAEMEWGCASEWSQHVINYFDNKCNTQHA